jgi:hypothetical protein
MPRFSVGRALRTSGIVLILILTTAYAIGVRGCGTLAGEALTVPIDLGIAYWQLVVVSLGAGFVIGGVVRLRSQEALVTFATILGAAILLVVWMIAPQTCTPI